MHTHRQIQRDGQTALSYLLSRRQYILTLPCRLSGDDFGAIHLSVTGASDRHLSDRQFAKRKVIDEPIAK